jgi:hypothetical protein
MVPLPYILCDVFVVSFDVLFLFMTYVFLADWIFLLCSLMLVFLTFVNLELCCVHESYGVYQFCLIQMKINHHNMQLNYYASYNSQQGEPSKTHNIHFYCIE